MRQPRCAKQLWRRSACWPRWRWPGAGTPTRGSRRAPTPASPAPTRPTSTSGPLIYEVQLSRQLNPCEQRATPPTSQGVAPAAGRLLPGAGVVRRVPAGLQRHHQPLLAAQRDHDHRHPGERLPADPDRPDEPVRLPRRDRAAPRACSRSPARPPACSAPRGSCCCSRSPSISLDNRPLEIKIVNPRNPRSSASAELDV